MPLKDPAQNRFYYRQGRERYPDSRWEYELRWRYNLSRAEYDALFERQGGCCLICGLPESVLNQRGVPRHLAVDHDVRVGRTRGLLCGNCNVAIGHMADDPTRLRAAADYLEKGSQEVTEFLQSLGPQPKLPRRGTNKTHCYRGHPLNDDNLYVHPNGARGCRACRRIADERPSNSAT